MMAAGVVDMSDTGKGGFGGEKAPVSVPVSVSFAPLPPSEQTRFRRFLVDKGISIGSLASGCEISKPYMNRIVNGRREPSIHLASRMSAFLGIPMDELYALVQPKPRSYKKGTR